MYSKTTLMALCAATAVNQVAAGHGHQRLHADKRELVWAATETVIVTDYVTVTVTGGQEATAAAVTTTSSRRRRPHHSHSKAQTTSVPVVTSAASTPVDIPESSATSAVDIPEPSVSSTPIAIPEPSASSTPVVIPEPSSSSTPVAITTAVSTTMTTAVKPSSTVIETTSVTTPTESSTVVDEPTIVIPITSPSATPEPTLTPIPNTGGKRGLAYNDASLVSEFLELGGQISWAYNWGSSTGDLPGGVAYYPMLWSPAPDHSNNWDELANDAIAKGSTALLSFNEPDIAAQANMSPQDAANGHIQWMNPYAGRARISTPAISSSQNAGQGIDWLNKFFDACGGQCHFDFCTAHWYGPGGVNGANLFLEHLKNVNDACQGKPVWVTEFAAESDNIDEFMSTIVQALESEEFGFVEKYSYFMASVGRLFNSPTELSSFGKVYAGIS